MLTAELPLNSELFCTVYLYYQCGFIIQIASCKFNICDLYPSQNCCMFNTVVYWSLLWGYHCFVGTCCLHLSSTLNMEAICFSEMLVSVILHGIPFQKNVVLTYIATRTWSHYTFLYLQSYDTYLGYMVSIWKKISNAVRISAEQYWSIECWYTSGLLSIIGIHRMPVRIILSNNTLIIPSI